MVLRNQSGPGGLHENTLLLVMGDHGQTLNEDHGGGTAEEVHFSFWVLSVRKDLFFKLIVVSCRLRHHPLQ